MARLLIVKTGTTVPTVRARKRDFDTWIRTAMGWVDAPVEVIEVHLDETLPPVEELQAGDGIVVTGSASLVTDRATWSERTTTWIAEVARTEVPMLGICYGHQLIAHALGGEVADNPRGRQIGTTDITLTEEGKRDPVFGGLGDVLHVPVSHMQSVTVLPDGARLLGTTSADPHHAFAIGDHIWGMQCHPEFDTSIVRGYIEERSIAIAAEGLDPDALSRDCVDSADGTLLLRRFADRIRG